MGFDAFWFFGPGEEDRRSSDFSLVTTDDRECMFVGSAGDCTKVFGGHKVVTLKGFFGEADRKFRLHPGDIFVMNAAYPFAVDLPIGGRAKGARALSWLILPKT